MDTILEPFWDQIMPRILGVQIMLRQKINERGKKAFLTGIILYKTKGGIRPYKVIKRPHKVI